MKGIAPLVVILLLVAAPGVESQTIRPEPNSGAPVFGGIVLGTLGFMGGAVLGSRMAGDCSSEWCDLGPAAVGALIGEALGMAGGAHLGNRSRGSLPLDLLTATGISALTLVAANANENSAGGALIGGIIAQVVATVAMERGTGRARARRAATLSLIPMPERRVGIALSVPLP